MSESIKSKTRFSEIVHDIEFGNLEPDFVFFRMETKFTFTKKIAILICGVGLIGFCIFAFILLHDFIFIISLPCAFLGALMIWVVLRLRVPLSDEVIQVKTQVYISSIDILIDYEFHDCGFQNSTIINCKTIPVTEDSFIEYVIHHPDDGSNPTTHNYRLKTGKEGRALRGEPHVRNDEFAKTYNIKIIQSVTRRTWRGVIRDDL